MPAIAQVGGGPSEPETYGHSQEYWLWHLLYLALVVTGYLGLFKLFSRWPPRIERWAVILSLFVLFLFGPPFLFGMIGSVVAVMLLAIAWWVLKTKTNWLKTHGLTAQALAVKAPLPARPIEFASEPAEARESPAREAVAPTTAARTLPNPELARAAPPAPALPARAATDSIFISYRRQDSADVTGRIYDRLLQRFDRKQIFKDVDSIPLGVDFRVHLGDVVGRCDLLIAVIGPQWLAAAGPNGRRLDDPSDFVRIEIEAALARNIPVIPVLVGGAELPAESALPASLTALTFRNGIAVRPDPDFHRDMDRLITGLELHRRA